METTVKLLQELKDKLELLRQQTTSFKAFVGFDGFVDRIQKAVKKKRVAGNEYFTSITEFAEHLKTLAGTSGQVELTTDQTNHFLNFFLAFF